MKKISMFKIEYLWGIVLHWNSIEIKPCPTFRTLKNISAVILHFLMHICEYGMTWSINLKYKIVTCMRWYRNRTIFWTAMVFHLCVFFLCDLTSWILTIVTRDNYQPLVTVNVFDGCFHARIESKSMWFDSRKISFVLLLQHHLLIRWYDYVRFLNALLCLLRSFQITA